MTTWILSYGDSATYENKRIAECFTAKGIEHEFVSPWETAVMVGGATKPVVLVHGEEAERPKVALVRYGAGIPDSMLAFIRQLSLLGTTVINDATSIAKAKDKFVTGQILSNRGIIVPRTIPVQLPGNLGLIEKHIGLPCVIKLVTGSYGEGVHLCKTRSELNSLMSMLAVVAPNSTVLAQEYIACKSGEDVRVLVVGGEIIGAMRRTAPVGDFRANISGGGTGSPHPLDPLLVGIVTRTVEALGLTIAGIDLLFTDGGYAVCEANSNPGFLGFERYCEIDVAARIADFVRKKL